MTKDELRLVLEQLGTTVPPDATHDELVATLEQETGCGCFGAECGEGYCGHQCGTCEIDQSECFSGSCVTHSTCPQIQPEAAEQDAVLKNNLETIQFRYEAALSNTEFDMIKVMSNSATQTVIGSGTYDLRRYDPSACELCVRAYKGCVDGLCTETYVATAGTITLEHAVDGENFVASLANVKFDQSYEDPKTGSVYPFPQPLARCVTTMDMTTKTETIIVEPSDCDPDGNGITIGSSIGDFTLTNCLGDPVSLHGACGAKAVWIVAAAGW